ncbi:MAG: hypothetical protein ACAH80_12385 [Alphaproteobacteria bacterium]
MSHDSKPNKSYLRSGGISLMVAFAGVGLPGCSTLQQQETQAASRAQRDSSTAWMIELEKADFEKQSALRQKQFQDRAYWTSKRD